MTTQLEIQQDGSVTEVEVLPPGIAPAEGQAPVKKKKTPAKPKAKGEALVVKAAEVAELEERRAVLAKDLEQVQAFPLDTQEQVDQLMAVSVKAKKEQESLKARMDKILAPLKQAQKETKALFEPPIEFLESIRTAIKNRVQLKLNEQRAAQAKALAAVAESAGRVDSATLELARGSEHVKPAQGSYEVEDWQYEITDLTKFVVWAGAEWTRFARFFAPVPVELAKYAREHKAAAESGGAAEIPGVRVYCNRRLVVRAGGEK